MKEEHQSLIRDTKSLPGEDEVRKTEGLSFRWVYAAALALVALGFLSTTSYYHNDKDASSSLPTLNRHSQYSNADSRAFSYKSVSATPLGIYSTDDGKVVISSDTDGTVYRSKDYGASWTTTKNAIKVSSGVYSGIYGLVMSSDGSTMIAGTATYATFTSVDYGASWSQLSSQTCSVLTADSTLTQLACIGGEAGSPPPKNTYIYKSEDGGYTWAKLDSLGSGKWIGIVADQTFTVVAAATYSGDYYFYYSSDGGATFTASEFDSSTSGYTWGCLAADRNLTTIMLTDTGSHNVHITTDGGAWFNQALSATSYNISGDVASTVVPTGCAVSADANVFAVGWQKYPVMSVFSCNVSMLNCLDHWKELDDCNSDGGDYDNVAVRLSSDGLYLFSTDASTNEIAVGVLDV